MATLSGASEGINLISSIYSDDDMEDIEHQEIPNDDVNTTAMENDTRNTNSEERGVDFVEDDTPPLSSDRFRPLTPQQQQPQLSLSSTPLQQPVVSEPSRSRLHRLTIVDYGHDEVALSPEAEDGEIVGAGVVVIGTQLQMTNGLLGMRYAISYRTCSWYDTQVAIPGNLALVFSMNCRDDPTLIIKKIASLFHFDAATTLDCESVRQLLDDYGDIQEKTPPGTAQVLSPNNKTNPQLSQQLDASESHTMNYAVNVLESTGIEEAVTVSMEASTDIDPFDRFLPPSPMARCSDELEVSSFQNWNSAVFESFQYAQGSDIMKAARMLETASTQSLQLVNVKFPSLGRPS
ncbi:hypothetical protein Acr_19g0000550 [Actinidia rufa]|uniref:Uncharacterized protein n=1 Tax=Actinidia rufa TaxID=165716 RepID=A0A7J0G8T7_9ERIC|nr:hypothetical protein Acr_19g0000550 [Actinidia rufa]